MFTPLHKTEAHLFFVIVSQRVAGWKQIIFIIYEYNKINESISYIKVFE